MQHELEASFIYEDTPDQLKATQEVKADMESDRPMDRLVCGDVGFGKQKLPYVPLLKPWPTISRLLCLFLLLYWLISTTRLSVNVWKGCLVR